MGEKKGQRSSGDCEASCGGSVKNIIFIDDDRKHCPQGPIKSNHQRRLLLRLLILLLQRLYRETQLETVFAKKINFFGYSAEWQNTRKMAK